MDKGFRRFCIHFLLVVGLILMVLPFLWMISTSFKTNEAIISIPPQWIPQNPTLLQYRDLFTQVNFWEPFKNTTLIAIVSTMLAILITAMAGYAFSKFHFPGREKLFLLLLGTMMIPSVIILIPLYLIIKEMNWLNTYYALIIPPSANIFNIFFFRQYMKTLPDELIEAARIDGAGEFQIFFTIMLPLAKPALATLAFLNFIGSWNNFMAPLIYCPDLPTLEVVIFNLYGQNANLNQGVIMAGAVIVLMPLIIAFISIQKYIIRGISFTGMKV